MALATILGIFLLLSWPCATIASASEMVIRQSTPAQESQPSNSSPATEPASKPATEQQNAPGQASPSQSPAPASAACAENSQTASTVKSDCKPTPSTGNKTRKHRHKAAAPATGGTASGPTKTVVRNGGAADPTLDLSPGLSPQQASHQTESTNQLLATSNANLKKIAGRQLNPVQQDTLKQIKSYMDQAKKAEIDGDLERAHTLAVKASLLSADLVGPEK
jgi:hypothetical protein